MLLFPEKSPLSLRLTKESVPLSQWVPVALKRRGKSRAAGFEAMYSCGQSVELESRGGGSRPCVHCSHSKNAALTSKVTLPPSGPDEINLSCMGDVLRAP